MLSREWGQGCTAVFIMLNPSTADAINDDPTIRKCVAFAQREGFGRLEVVNLFAYRATDPHDLVRAHAQGFDVVGPANDTAIQWAGARTDSRGYCTKICAWGAHGGRFPERVAQVKALLQGEELFCFGVTKEGHPRHPLYLSLDTSLVTWK